ncbi:cytidylyltransferase domain-containing protein [Ekhidna sp.]|uniref:acylneuraminate cytidylyltransferase family protein n=1 Tax=Ekhidna sp. TaxID=2608089 RepID=UPI003B513E07
MKIIAMIPARLGSQRLKKKNLKLLKGEPLISHAINKTIKSEVFDEVWVNSESEEIGEVARSLGVNFHKRPENLANNQATSEDFVYEFFTYHECDYLVQIHSIAPLLKKTDIVSFVKELSSEKYDVLLSAQNIQIECAYKETPVNFTMSRKDNSQDLSPIQRITWSITGWKRSTYMDAYETGNCSTYAGNVGYFEVNSLAAHVIKTQEDLDIAEALYHKIDE